VRRFLTIVSCVLAVFLGISVFRHCALSSGYFESPVPHDPPPVAPDIDTKAALPSAAEMESLARTHPVAFLRACLSRYRREVHGYICILDKQERLNGKLGPVETINVGFREEPFSALLLWQTPPAGMADRALYVAGQNGGKALARGKFLHMINPCEPYSAAAMSASRYALPEFGMAKGTERSLAAWERAAKQGKLKVEYLGIRPAAEAGGVPCYVLRRTCDTPEEDGVVTVEVNIDAANWLQVGNVLTAAGGDRIAAYYFRNVALNPNFPANQFEPKALK
jgi:hypothetical protein